MIKILVLGNNDQSTDEMVEAMARENNSVNHGLVLDPDFLPIHPGFYHTTVADLSWGSLVSVADKFDKIIMLDQPAQAWSSWKCLLSTYKVMCHLEDNGKVTEFRQNQNTQNFQFWAKYQKQNRSFCLYPWIVKFVDNGEFKPCARSHGKSITDIKNFTTWKDDKGFNLFRSKMLAGELLPETCKVCYMYEENNIESYREFETMDWVAKLGLDTLEDLESIDQPYYYEIHAGNKCNIKCRGCSPGYSDQIDKEFRQFNITPMRGMRKLPNKLSIDCGIDIASLGPKHRVYFQGGEPTIMPEVIEFMKKCRSMNRLDFELSMCTNGMVMSQEFLENINHFSQVNFSFSIDGFDRVNDYWRWGSKWEKVIRNMHLVRDLGHKISINTVPGIYNVTNLHLLFEFLDREFPEVAVYIQINYLPSQSSFNHPRADLVVASMEKCKQTRVYYSDGKSCKTAIDNLYNHYLGNPVCDLTQLAEFFRFNDQLDLARNSKLGDYIPELEACRSLIK